MDTYNDDFFKENEDVLSKIKISMMNGMDAQYRLVRSIYEWSTLSIPLLTKFIAMVKQNDTTKLNAEKLIFVQVLKDGIEKMNRAQQDLDKSNENFSQASEAVEPLITRIDEKIKKKAQHVTDYLQRAANPGFIIATSMEEKRLNDFKAKVAPIQKLHDEWKENLNKAIADNKETETKMKERIQSISDLKAEVETDDVNKLLDPDFQKSAIEYAENLIAEFIKFQSWFNQLK